MWLQVNVVIYGAAGGFSCTLDLPILHASYKCRAATVQLCLLDYST